jgi:chromate transporter
VSAALPLQQPARAPLGAIAKAFLTVSVFGFGGGIVWARRIAVEQRGWLSAAEFLDIVSLCQFLPGPNIIGIAVCMGTKLRGAPGALAAIAGFLVLPWSVGLFGLFLGVVCLRYAQAPLLRHVLGGVSAAAAGLLIATGLRLLLPHRRRPFVIGLALLVLILMAFSRLPLPIVLIALLPLNIALSAVRRL